MSARALANALEGLTERQATNRDIVESLCNGIRDCVLAEIKGVPDDWDGHEMREILALLFDRERTGAMSKGKRAKRFREFMLDHPNLFRGYR